MDGFGLYLATSLALICVIEGLLYALFPDLVRRLMTQAIIMPAPRLRLFGLSMAAAGFGMVWLLRALHP